MVILIKLIFTVEVDRSCELHYQKCSQSTTNLGRKHKEHFYSRGDLPILYKTGRNLLSSTFSYKKLYQPIKSYECLSFSCQKAIPAYKTWQEPVSFADEKLDQLLKPGEATKACCLH